MRNSRRFTLAVVVLASVLMVAASSALAQDNSYLPFVTGSGAQAAPNAEAPVTNAAEENLEIWGCVTPDTGLLADFPKKGV